MKRQSYSSGTRWEPVVGYSRAVRVGAHVAVTGTTATGEDGAIVGRGDAYAQTVQTLRNIGRALAALGAGFEHVVRTRMYVTDITRWQEVGRAHAEVFGEARPVTAMYEIAGMIDPRMLAEVELDAYLG